MHSTRTRRHTVGCASAAVLALTLLALPGRAESPPAAPRDDDVVARVNGPPIRRKEVRELVQGVLAMQDTAPDPSAIPQLARDALESLIDLDLLAQESKARGITVSDADVDAEIARARQGFPDARAFAAALKERGMTEAELRQDTRKTMAVDRLLASSTAKDASVADDDVKRFYAENRAAFKHPAQVRLSTILVRIPDGATTAQRAAARARADELLATLRGGAEFAAVARAHSDEKATAPGGGDLGYVATGELPDEIAKEVTALQPGQTSGVITSPYGFMIVTVTARRDAGITPLGEVEAQIRAVLERQARQGRQAAFVATLRKSAKIEYGAPL
jgi:parvulin-like peptidyl-prolyl isomerase